MSAAIPFHWLNPCTWSWFTWLWLALFVGGLSQQAWRWLHRKRAEGWPTVQGRIEGVTVGRKEQIPISFSHTPRVLAAIATQTARVRVIAVGRDLRPSYSEALGLLWRDVLWDRAMIAVRQSFVHSNLQPGAKNQTEPQPRRASSAGSRRARRVAKANAIF